jgi:hypothetical protein
MNALTHTRQSQHGVVLFISLIMLVVIGMLTMSLMGMSRIEMRLANNEEARISGLQMAQALSDMIVARPDMTPVVGSAGFKLCVGAQTGCDMDMDMTDIPANDITAAVDGGYLRASAARQEPEFRPPPRGMGFSASKFVATSFRLESEFDRTEDGQGHAGVEEGLTVLIPL